MHVLFSRLGAVSALLLSGMVAGIALAPSVKADPIVLHSFESIDSQNRNSGGAIPVSGLIQGGDGDWYGTTLFGGPAGAGTLFKMHADGSGFAVIKTFDGGVQAPDGGFPGGVLTRGQDGSLYGSTSNGGANGGGGGASPGTIFQVSPTGQFQTLQSFPANSDQSSGGGEVFQAGDGLLYGCFDHSGGDLFRMNPDGTGYQTIHSFPALNPDGTSADGSSGGLAPVEGNDGLLYGVHLGGGVNEGGTFYRIAKDGTGFTVLHDFEAISGGGIGPSGRLVKGLDGAFYGITSVTGANGAGTVYRVDTAGNFQTLMSFPALSSSGVNTAGANPVDGNGLIQGPDGTLYGVTYKGGAHGAGTVYSVRPDGSRLTNLRDFAASDIAILPSTASDNGLRYHVVLGSPGHLYITTDGGGVNGTGAILSQALPSATHVLWTNTNNAASIWDYDTTAGTYTHHEYGPFSGYAAKAIADSAADGKTRVLWDNADGTASVWSLDNSAGVYTHAEFGPFAGWTANAISAGTDGTTHLLWTNADGQASVWNYNAATGNYTNHEYGPYAGWSANAITDGGDGKTRLLWDNADGRMSLWSLDNAAAVFSQFSFGPYGGWAASGVSVGADGMTHVLWDNSDGRLSLWNDSTVTGIFSQITYGPFAGWTAAATADGSDGKTRVLWDNINGAASIWSLNSSAGVYTHTEFGPFSGWTAVGVSAQ